MTAWKKYRELYEKYRYKLRIKIHEYLMNGVNVNCRQGSESLETFILENNDKEAIEIMEKIEDEFRK